MFPQYTPSAARMERLLLLFVISSLFPGACSLTCHKCIPDGTEAPCTDSQTDCGFASYLCGSQRIVSSADGKMLANISMKSCMTPQECFSYSINLGLSKMVMNSKCCFTDNCNTEDAPATTGGANGKECYTCNGEDCTVKIKCEGIEDHCISAKFTAGDQKKAMKGCASKSACSVELRHQLLNSGMVDMECCQGNMCNGGVPAINSSTPILNPITRTVPAINSSTPITVKWTVGVVVFFTLLHVFS